MLLKYILVFCIINSHLTFSTAANVKRHRKSNNHHAKAKKNKFSDENPPSFLPTEDPSDSGDLEWLSESTKTRNVVLTKSKTKIESTSEQPKSGLEIRDKDKQLADYKASKKADDLVSKMSLKKVMVKEIMEVEKVYETGSTEIIINPRDLWNEKNGNQPAMKVVQYLFEKPTTTSPSSVDETIDIKVFESVKTVESTFSPNMSPNKLPESTLSPNKLSESTEPPTTTESPPPPSPPANNNKSPRRKKPSRLTRKPTAKPLDFDEFLKVIFGNYNSKKDDSKPVAVEQRDEIEAESESKLNTDDDEAEENLKFSMKNDGGGKSSDVVNLRTKIQARNSPQQPTTTKPSCDEDEEEVETTVEETNSSVVATKIVQEMPEDFEPVENNVGKRSKAKRNSAVTAEKSHKGAKRYAPKKTRSCRKKRLQEEVITFTQSITDYGDDDFSTNIVYTMSEV